MDDDAALASLAEIRKDWKSNATALTLRADRLSVACVASDWLLRTRIICICVLLCIHWDCSILSFLKFCSFKTILLNWKLFSLDIWIIILR
ncbi:unnamed protein product [Gadus morhua 'NCC']